MNTNCVARGESVERGVLVVPATRRLRRLVGVLAASVTQIVVSMDRRTFVADLVFTATSSSSPRRLRRLVETLTASEPRGIGSACVVNGDSAPDAASWMRWRRSRKSSCPRLTELPANASSPTSSSTR